MFAVSRGEASQYMRIKSGGASMKVRKFFVLAIAVVVLIGAGTAYPAFGDEMAASPFYLYTSFVEADLSIDGSGNATCVGYVKVKDSTSSISMTVTLYRQFGAAWGKVTSWNDSVIGASSLEIDEVYRVGSGNYKVEVTGTVTSAAGGSETFSETSGVVTY